MAISDKLNYLIETKSKFKDRLNSLGAEITASTTFRNYLNWLDNFYIGSANKTELSKNGVVGRTSQDGDPTPENPVEINNLSGNVEYKVTGEGISESFPLSLGDIELCKIGTYQDRIFKSSGKNLFDKNTITSGYRLDGSGIANGSASNEFTSDFIEVESGETYIRNYGDISAYTRTCFYDKNKSFVSKNDDSQSFTIPDNVKYIRFSEYLSRLDTIQFEKGTSSSEYEPYGKDWYLNKQIGKVVLDGSENWSINTSYTYNVFYRTLGDYARISNTQTTYCEYYKGIENTAGIVDFGNNYNNSIGVRTANDNIKDIYISNNSITSASGFKTWLSTHNTVVYYVLATPTTTEITQENYPTLYSQLLAIQEFLTKYKINKEFLLDYSSPEIEY